MDSRLIDLSDEAGFDRAVTARVVVVYKHSDRCYACRRSLGEMRRFVAQWPDVPVYIVDVVGRRVLARTIAQRLEVRHESPQAILIRGGRVVWHASHSGVTADALAAELRRLDATGRSDLA